MMKLFGYCLIREKTYEAVFREAQEYHKASERNSEILAHLRDAGARIAGLQADNAALLQEIEQHKARLAELTAKAKRQRKKPAASPDNPSSA